MTRLLQARDVERIGRDVISHAGLDLTVLAARPADAGWILAVRDSGNRIIELALPEGSSAHVRRALSAVLDGWSADVPR